MSRQMGKGVVLLSSAMLVLCGCSMFVPWNQTLSVNCNQPDATAVINGHPYTLPAEVSVRRNKRCTVEVTKAGFEPYDKRLTIEPSTTGLIDLVGCYLCLFPAIGLFTPGAFELAERDVYVNLIPKESGGSTNNTARRQ